MILGALEGVTSEAERLGGRRSQCRLLTTDIVTRMLIGPVLVDQMMKDQCESQDVGNLRWCRLKLDYLLHRVHGLGRTFVMRKTPFPNFDPSPRVVGD